MLKKDDWKELSTRLGIEVDKLQELISSDKEEAVEFSKVTLFTDDQLDTLKEKVGKDSAKTGSKTIVEMKVKTLRDKHGLEFEGKDIETLMESYADKLVKDAKVAPNKQLDEQKESFKKLQKTYDETVLEKDGKISGLQSEIGNYKVSGEMAKHLPDGLIGIKPNQFNTLAKTELSFGYDDDGIFVAKKGDKILKDNREIPLPVKDVLTDYAKANGWLTSNGRGGGDNNGDGNEEIKTIPDAYAYMHKNKIKPDSAEGEKLLAAVEQS